MSTPRDCPVLLVSAPASGQGKTSVTAALARWHRRQGRRVRVFKTGPDFLDPMVLERASGAPVQQLDLWMCGEADVRARLYAAAGEADLILVEGVMGLFDGDPSSADLAQRLGLPVLAVIDGSAMAQTFGALATGLARYRDGLKVHGVAANRVGSAYHVQLLAQSLPPELHWLGALPRDPAMALPERHLGLVAAGELADIDARLDALADAWALHAATELPPAVTFAPAPLPGVEPLLAGRRIAIARDAAFCFLYPANLALLRAAGAELAWFSPLAGDDLPDCDAAWLPGGYPELHLDALSRQHALHDALRTHRDAGKPLLAECGGLLFALDTLADLDGNERPMAGLLPGRAAMQSRLAGLGMQEVMLPESVLPENALPESRFPESLLPDGPPAEGPLRGHTFHRAKAEVLATPIAQTVNPNKGPSLEGVYRDRRLTASFMHFYFPSAPRTALRLFLP